VVDPMHFDGMADAYGAARPPYPAELWRDVVATGLVGPGRRALDLGAGTGQATGELLAHGMDVVAVEPGGNLARVFEQRHPRATVLRSRAEDLQLGDGSFDLAVAATSIHWMDLEVMLPIVHGALTTDGRFLVWRNVFGDADAEITPFRREVYRIVQRRGTRREGGGEDAETTARSIVDSGLFSVGRLRRYRWSIELTSQRVRSLFATFSEWSAAEAEEAASAAEALGGSVTEHYTSWLIEATPLPPASHPAR
jgi:SAM-dependent methyltransferase